MAALQQHMKVTEFKSWDYSRPHALFCENHTEQRWYWKGPGRNLHYSGPAWPECPCPFADLMVILQPEDAEFQH